MSSDYMQGKKKSINAAVRVKHDKLIRIKQRMGQKFHSSRLKFKTLHRKTKTVSARKKKEFKLYPENVSVYAEERIS